LYINFHRLKKRLKAAVARSIRPSTISQGSRTCTAAFMATKEPP